MDIAIVAALAAGLVATAVMSLMMRMAVTAGLSDMPPMELVTGAMATGDQRRAMTFGALIHWGLMGTVLFGLGYAAVFSAAGSTSLLVGAGVGLVHGLVVGLVFMPMMPAMHPRMTGRPAAAAITGGHADGVRLEAPGLLGVRWGGMTPVGLLVGHVVYGVVAALVYGLLT